MNDEKMQEIISNPDNIIKIIEALNDNFSMLYLKYTMKSLKNLNSNIDYNNMNLHSATSYYLNGHCVSYAEILCQIFEKYAIKYNSDGHIIVKIGEHFYDAR